MDCIFCKIVKKELPSHRIYEDKNFVAFLDIHPVSSGHALIVSKNHYHDLLAAPPKVLDGLIEVAQKVGLAVIKATDSKGFNLSLNNGEAAGQVVPHLHFHVIPRRPDDKLVSWPHGNYPEGEAAKIAEVIKGHIQ